MSHKVSGINFDLNYKLEISCRKCTSIASATENCAKWFAQEMEYWSSVAREVLRLTVIPLNTQLKSQNIMNGFVKDKIF